MGSRIALRVGFAVALIAAGAWLLADQRLAARAESNADEPTISVETNFRGADIDVVASRITQPLEESLSGIDGIDTIISISRAERSRITIKFHPRRGYDSAAADVRDRIARGRGRLPAGLAAPVVAKVAPDDQPVAYLGFFGTHHPALQVTDYVERFVVGELQRLDGVAEVRVFGARRSAIRIWLDTARFAAYGLTLLDIEAALRSQGVVVQAGRIESGRRELIVLAGIDTRAPERLLELTVKAMAGDRVRLGDVGTVEAGSRDDGILARFNGQSAVVVEVIKRPGASTPDLTLAVREALPAMLRYLPAGMAYKIGYSCSRCAAPSSR